MPELDVPLERIKFGQTSRKDSWWAQPLATVIGLVTGFGYLTWAMFQPKHYWHGPYLSPVGAPPVFGDSPFSWFGAPPSFWPSFLPWQMLILWGPLAFRLTCYYYRGTYYKAFWGDPPACAVGEPRKGYRGENSFPLIIQNIHRYAFYIAAVFILFLAWDVIMSVQYPNAHAPETHFGLGLGTIIMTGNVVLISLYTFSCHSFRHLIGGVLDIFSKSPVRKKAWDCVSCLNRKHGLWAWFSLGSMCLTDLYIRLCSMGVITDWRIF